VSLASFPPAVSWPGASFPPRGPSGRFPRFPGTMRRSDSPSPIPPRFVAFAERYHGCTRVSFPGPPGAPDTGLELVTRYLQPGSAVEAAGPPRFLGNPCERVLLSDPGGITDARPLRRRDAAFRHFKNVGSRDDDAFGAQSHGPFARCLRFAAPVARTPRKTRFRPLAKLCRTGLVTRRVPMKGFRLWLPPFPSFAWRTQFSSIVHRLRSAARVRSPQWREFRRQRPPVPPVFSRYRFSSSSTSSDSEPYSRSSSPLSEPIIHTPGCPSSLRP
jgi:hypothetical protein